MSQAIYLMFNGNCEEAINFYKKNLEANVIAIQRYGEAPVPSSESYKDKVMHAVMDVKGLKVMCSDSGEKRNVTFGDNYSIVLEFKSDGDIDRTFDAMATGGQITMPLEDTFWGAKFGMCTDKFGVNWMFNFEKNQK